jgi:hypothetical protein
MKVPTYRRTRKLQSLCAGCGKPLWSDEASVEVPLIMHRSGSRDKAPEVLYHPKCAPGPGNRGATPPA